MSYILAKPVQMCVSEQKYTWKILLYLVYDLLLPRYFKHWYFLINESESLQLRNKDLRHTPNTQVHLCHFQQCWQEVCSLSWLWKLNPSSLLENYRKCSLCYMYVVCFMFQICLRVCVRSFLLNIFCLIWFWRTLHWFLFHLWLPSELWYLREKY